MTITVADLNLPAIDSGITISNVQKGSAFQRAGREEFLPIGGTQIGVLSGIEGYGVAEGGEKTASGEAESKTMSANKVAVATVLSEEAVANARRLYDLVTEEQPGAAARLFDLVVAGLKAKPASFANFVVLDALNGELSQSLNIAAGETASVSLDTAKDMVTNADTNTAVFTTSMLSYLRTQRVGATGARVFDIVLDEDGKAGYIDGLRFYVIASNVRKGWVGDFTKYFYGNTEFANPLTGLPWRLKDQGNITDANGVVHNLTSSNKIAVIFETHVGSLVVDPNAIVVVTPAGDAPVEPEARVATKSTK